MMRRASFATALLGLAVTFGGASAREAIAADGVAVSPDTGRLVRQGTRHEALYDVVFEGEQGVAVGSFGTVLASTDGGRTWLTGTLATRGLALLAVTRQAGRCVAVGQSGQVWRAADCRTWQPAASGTPGRLLGVAMNRNGLAYAVGAFGTLLRSTDAGQTWAAVAPDWAGLTPDGAEPHLYGVHVADDGTVTVVGEFGLVLRAEADASRWKVLHKGEASLFGLTVADGGRRLYAVGQGGQLLRSGDGGSSWSAVPTGSTAVLTRVAVAPGGELVVAGLNTLLRSRDDGRRWQRIGALAPNAWFQAVVALPGDGPARALAAGAGGTLFEVPF